MADLRISELAALASADLVAGDLLAVADISASESKKITVTDFLGKAVTLIADATIPGAKIVFGAASIPGSALQNLAVGSSQIAADAVTAAKLGDESTVDLVTTLPASGAFVGQIALDTDDSKAYIWNGSTWISFKAAGSINTAIASSSGVINIAVVTSGDTLTITASLNNSTAASQFVAGPSGSAGAVSLRPIVGADLPVASASAKGGVIVNGNGLAMSGDIVTIGNTVTPETVNYHVVRYGPQGLITAGRTITAADLPPATVSTTGVVIPGTGLAVLGDGTLNHSNAVSAGSGAKVSFNAEGHITGTLSLEAADIPEIPATKLTSGTLSASVIGANTITGNKLANSSTTKFGGAGSTTGVVAFPNADFTGQYFFDSINGDLYLWDGNAWQPITITSGEIVFAGTYNANTNLVASVTTAGTAAGLTVSSALPAASAANNRYYVVVSIAGTGSAPAPAVALAAPDMLLSNGTAWQELDVSTTVTAQLASNVSFAPTGTIASNNVQTALAELDTEKLAVAGGTITGELLIGAAGTLVLEGSTADGFETTIAVVDPTADRTITLPNVTGTVITTGDSGTVTSTMILDGTIVNADINASAAIADTKLATIATALKVSNSATTAASANTASAIVARDASGNFSAGTITAALTGAASSNVLKAGDTMTGPLITPLGSDGVPSLTFTGDPNTGIYSPGADQLAVATNGTGRLFVDASGNVGIGTASPGALLDVRGTTSTRINLGVTGSASRAFLDYTEAGFITTLDADGDIRFSPNNAEAVRITADGKVGIGTTSPRFALSIGNASPVSTATPDTLDLGATFSSTSGANPKLRVYEDGSNTYGFGVTTSQLEYICPTSASHVFFTAGTPRLRIDSSGNVGIGTTSPARTLDITPSSVNAVAARFGNVAGRGLEISTFLTQTVNDAGVAFNALGAGVGAIAFQTDSNERARIDSSGRLLVGTSSSSAPTSAVFQGNSSGASGSGLVYLQSGSAASSISSGTEVGRLRFADNTGGLYAEIMAVADAAGGTNDYPGRLVFSTTADGASSPTERMRITNGGNVLFNATAVVEQGLVLISYNGGANQGAIFAESDTTSGNTAIRFKVAGSTVGSITTTSAATAFNTSSDYRLKENVTEVTDGITRLQQLKPSRFNFIADPDTVVDGFIAHEAAAVVPECVTGTKDAVDDEGNPIYQGIDQSKLVPLLTAALQEAVAKIVSLEARLTAAGL